MNDVKIARLTGVFGLVCVALTFGQFPLWLVGSPPSVYDGREFAQHLFDIKRVALTRILMDHGIYASMLIFAAGLRHLIRQARAESEWIGTLLFGAALYSRSYALPTQRRRSTVRASRHMHNIKMARLVSVVAAVFTATGAGAQTPVEPSSNVGAAVGMAVHRLQDDFGLSANWSSPAFLDGKARITAGGGVAWYPYGTSASGDQDWVPFGHSRVVVESGHRVGRAPLRLYGFGGAMLAFRSERLSDDVLAVAGIGGFGFEFFPPTSTIDAPVSYFIEIGGVGSGARATNLPGHPILLNGFLVQSGVRFYPCRRSAC